MPVVSWADSEARRLTNVSELGPPASCSPQPSTWRRCKTNTGLYNPGTASINPHRTSPEAKRRSERASESQTRTPTSLPPRDRSRDLGFPIPMARRRARAERRAAAQRQATDHRRAEAVLPPVRAGPRALALRDRVPTHEEVAAYLLNRPSRNRLTCDQIKRRQWLPLPPRAPKIEESVFKFRKSDKTGHGLADMLLESVFQ